MSLTKAGPCFINGLINKRWRFLSLISISNGANGGARGGDGRGAKAGKSEDGEGQHGRSEELKIAAADERWSDAGVHVHACQRRNEERK